MNPEERLKQATCAVFCDGEIVGTAWLVSREGHLLTAGHVLGMDEPKNEVEVQFVQDVRRKAVRVEWRYDEKEALDFAVLKLNAPVERHPLPVSLVRQAQGSFWLCGYGTTMKERSQYTGQGQLSGSMSPIHSEKAHLFRLRHSDLGKQGNSGGAVFSDEEGAVVAIQIEVARARIDPEAGVVLAMPLYRVAQLWPPLQKLARQAAKSNPFYYTRPTLPADFIGRWSLVEEMVSDLCQARPDSSAVIGGRRFGKSSVLKAIESRLQAKNAASGRGERYYQPLIVDLKRCGTETEEQIYACILRSLYRILRRQPASKIELDQSALYAMRKSKSVPFDEFEDVLDDLTRRFENRNVSWRLVLLLDEAEFTISFSWSETLFNNIRALIHDGLLADTVSVVLTGSAHVVQARQTGSPLLNAVKIKHLTPFSPTALKQLIAQAGQMPDDATAALQKESGGHPFIAQYLLHHLWNQENGLTAATPAQVEQVAQKMRHDRGADLRGWWQAIGESGQNAYRVLVHHASWVDERTLRRAFDGQNLDLGLSTLCYHGLAARDKHFPPQYRVASHLFRAWFLRNIVGEPKTDDTPAATATSQPAHPSASSGSANLPTSGMKDASRGPRVEYPPHFELPHQAFAILREMYQGYERVVIKDNYSALGYSGSWVIRVHLLKGGSAPELPVVVKIASPSLIEKEWHAYQNDVENKWTGIAELRGQPLFQPELAALSYPLIGGGVFGVKSLREYCLEAKISDIHAVLEDRLFQMMKERILRPSQNQFEYPLQASYDAVLPVNLLIEPKMLAGKAPILITPDKLPFAVGADKPLLPGTAVRLEGFLVTKVDLRHNTVTLNLPPVKANAYRLRLRSVKELTTYRINEPIPPLEGVVIESRQSRFESELAKLGFEQPARHSVTLANGTTLPNPLLSISTILSKTRHLKFNSIHGDMNLENVLVDPHVRDVRLIDFAEARRDHVLHDFFRLEMEVVTKLLPLALTEANLSHETICSFYETLHCATFHRKQTAPQQIFQGALDKPFAIIVAIRKAASEGFYSRDDFSEYYEGLMLYLLGALRFQNLDSFAKQLAFKGAAIVQKLRELGSPCVDKSPSLLPTKLSFRHRTITPIAKPKAYHNLPQPNYGHFVGRKEELKNIARILRPYPHSQHALVTIDGIGGIGKSTLALEIAHTYRRYYNSLAAEQRFEAIIWISAKPTVLTTEGVLPRNPELRTRHDIYSAIAITLQREHLIGAKSQNLAQVIHHALTQQRTLLIIDNLETVDDEDVLNFLRELPAPTKAIVTTRHRIDVAYPVRLVGMPWQEVQELIAQECEKKGVTLSDEEARRLYKRTGGVPLAIVWSIAQISLGYEPEAILTRLGTPHTDIARFCFEASIERIRGKPAYKLLITLSLFVTDASREALGQVTGLPEIDRDEGLVELEKLSLVNKSGRRFSLLPLTASFARAQVENMPELEASIRLVLIHYFLDLSRKLGGDEWRSYHILHEDVQNIQQVMDWAYQLKMWREFGEIVNNFGNFLHKSGLWHELVSYAEMALEAGRQLNDQRLIMQQKLFGLGWIKAIRLRKFEEGLASIKEGQQIALQLGDQNALATALRNQGVIYRELGQYEHARQCLRESLKTWRTLQNPLWEIKLLGSLGEAEFKSGNVYDALRYYTDALQKAEQNDEKEQQAINLRRLSQFYQRMKNFKAAHAKASEALKIFDEINVASGAARCHIVLAEVEHSLGRIDEAKKQAKRAIALSSRLNLAHRLERAQNVLERLNQATNRQPVARKVG